LSGERVERRLAAILAADVAGYSRLMGRDEAGTLARLKALRRELIDPTVAEHKGRIVKTTGDGLLIEFPSVVEAVACAASVQQEMAERNADVPEDRRIEFRIGINSGDVIVEDGDIHGDGVNIAARLEALAEPGGICVSAIVHDQVQGRLDCAFEDLGEQSLKNIARPIRVYRVGSEIGSRASRPLSGVDAAGTAAVQPAALPLPDKPSIAVLPFQNMSGDPEQEYFVDGMVEEIITALSRIRWLFVIARNSSFTYKGQAVDVKRVGRELGVRYVLEGSVRKAGGRVRITGQLIDTATGAHIWADRFDGALDDVFELQDQVAASVAGAIGPKLEQVEIGRAKRKPPENLDAYDCYLRGIAEYYPATKEASDEMLRLLCRSIELDPGFASAYGMAAWCYTWRKGRGWMSDPAHEAAEGARLARKAAALGKDDALALAWAGNSLLFLVGDIEDAAAFTDQALALNPNLAVAWGGSGWIKVSLGEPDLAIDHLARAMRLSPFDPITAGFHTAAASAHFFAGRYDEALASAARAFRENPRFPLLRTVAAANALAGRMEEAADAMARLRQLSPELRVSNLSLPFPLKRAEDFAKYREGLRLAGLPEE